MNAFESKFYKRLKIRFLLTIPLHFYIAWYAYHRWVIVNTDPNEVYRGILVPVLLMVMLVFMLLLMYFSGLWHRCAMKISVDDIGIRTGGLGIGKTEYRWDEIRSYGIDAKNENSIVVYLSTDEHEKMKDENKFMRVSKKRIVFQIYDELWNEISSYIPADIRYALSENTGAQEIKIFTR